MLAVAFLVNAFCQIEEVSFHSSFSKSFFFFFNHKWRTQCVMIMCSRGHIRGEAPWWSPIWVEMGMLLFTQECYSSQCYRSHQWAVPLCGFSTWLALQGGILWVTDAGLWERFDWEIKCLLLKQTSCLDTTHLLAHSLMEYSVGTKDKDRTIQVLIG